MYDHVSEVDQNPGAVGIAFDAADAVVCRFDFLDDCIRNGSRLDLRTSRDENEGVGEDGASADVDFGEVLTLLVEGGVADDVD